MTDSQSVPTWRCANCWQIQAADDVFEFRQCLAAALASAGKTERTIDGGNAQQVMMGRTTAQRMVFEFASAGVSSIKVVKGAKENEVFGLTNGIWEEYDWWGAEYLAHMVEAKKHGQVRNQVSVAGYLVSVTVRDLDGGEVGLRFDLGWPAGAAPLATGSATGSDFNR